MTRTVTSQVVLPVANENDAARTCTAVRPYLTETAEIVALYVIEKRKGAPQPASTEQLEEHGQKTLDVVEEAFADSSIMSHEI